jgi:hypothetical protein
MLDLPTNRASAIVRDVALTATTTSSLATASAAIISQLTGVPDYPWPHELEGFSHPFVKLGVEHGTTFAAKAAKGSQLGAPLHVSVTLF